MTVISRNAIIRVMAADRSQHTVAVLGTLGRARRFRSTPPPASRSGQAPASSRTCLSRTSA